ncbi:hypothetical protein K492DRAFT_135240, partial [Lichtheimia hyalospora FSU 10163]
IDEEYMPGSDVHTDCHRFGTKSAITQSAGLLGTPGAKCDSPIELAEKTLEYISREWRDKIDFVVWTGDNSRHDWDKKYRPRKRKAIYHLNERVQQMMQRAFWPTARDPRHIPVIPTLGNNDVYPHNTMGSGDDETDLLQYFSRLWQPWIPTDQRATFRQGGYFAVNVGPRLRVLSLNTMYFYHKNDAVKKCSSPGSPAHDMLLWFERELIRARAAHVRVYVMGHVPPTTKHYRKSCIRGYTRIAAAYPDVLMGHFFGHLNMDHFLMLDARDAQDDDDDDDDFTHLSINSNEDDDDHVHTSRNINKYVNWLRDMYEDIDPIDHHHAAHFDRMPVVAVQVAPSVLPVYYPALRIYKYEIHDDDDRAQCHHGSDKRPHGTLLEYNQFYANITRWEEELETDVDETPLNYEFEYNSRDAYELDDLTITSYYNLAKRMVATDDGGEGQRLWSRYVQNMFVQALNDSSFPL